MATKIDEQATLSELKILTQDICDYLLKVIKPQKDYEKERELVLATLFCKAFKHYQAVNVLCKNGFGQDAMVITRVIVELYIKMKYLFDDTKKAIKEKRPEKYMYSSGWELKNGISKYETESGLDRSYFTEKHRKLANATYKKLIDKYGVIDNWKSVIQSLHNMATDVNELKLYRTSYSDLSHLVHSNSLGFIFYNDGEYFDYKSSDYQQLITLGIATNQFMIISRYYQREFGQIQTKPMNRFVKRLIDIYTIVEAE